MFICFAHSCFASHNLTLLVLYVPIAFFPTITPPVPRRNTRGEWVSVCVGLFFLINLFRMNVMCTLNISFLFAIDTISADHFFVPPSLCSHIQLCCLNHRRDGLHWIIFLMPFQLPLLSCLWNFLQIEARRIRERKHMRNDSFLWNREIERKNNTKHI